jgi:hypothetical protein
MFSLTNHSGNTQTFQFWAMVIWQSSYNILEQLLKEISVLNHFSFWYKKYMRFNSIQQILEYSSPWISEHFSHYFSSAVLNAFLTVENTQFHSNLDHNGFCNIFLESSWKKIMLFFNLVHHSDDGYLWECAERSKRYASHKEDHLYTRATELLDGPLIRTEHTAYSGPPVLSLMYECWFHFLQRSRSVMGCFECW